MIRPRGLFLTFEGSDGLGKSTALRYLSNILCNQGIALETSREPGGTPIGERLRTVLKDNSIPSLNHMSELFLIFAARCQHITSKIEPTLENGKWLLCDRFSDATYAYQGGGRSININCIEQIEALAGIDLVPDYSFLFDAPPELGLARTIGRGKPDRFEEEDINFYNRVREVYLDRASRDPSRWCVIDASQSIENVEKNLAHECKRLIDNWYLSSQAENETSLE